MTHNLSDDKHHDCRPHARGSVRRASGFVLTGNSEVIWEDNGGRQQLTAIPESPTPCAFCPHFCTYPLIRPSMADTIAYSCSSEVTSEEEGTFGNSLIGYRHMQQITHLRWMQISTALLALWLLIANLRTVAPAPTFRKTLNS